MFKIDKTFEFCYGHRVHNQALDGRFSDGLCKCRHLHGHNGTVKLGIEAETLQNGMVTDFKHLDFFKKLLDDVLDHKFIIDYNDPLFDELFNNAKQYVEWEKFGLTQIGRIPQAISARIAANYDDASTQAAVYEKLDGLVVVNFVPTSENLCKFLARVAEGYLKEFLGERARVSFVEFWETPKSHCRYEVVNA